MKKNYLPYNVYEPISNENWRAFAKSEKIAFGEVVMPRERWNEICKALNRNPNYWCKGILYKNLKQ